MLQAYSCAKPTIFIQVSTLIDNVFPCVSSGEFPSLQTRMRSVLRVEVDAVKFLKEEPHKLDSMLKRVKSLTDTLSGLRR